MNTSLIPNERIISRIFLIRGRKVMIDRDLAELYGVETKMFVRAVKRNIKRFPSDFMFQLSEKEFKNLRFHFGTSSWGGRLTPVLCKIKGNKKQNETYSYFYR